MSLPEASRALLRSTLGFLLLLASVEGNHLENIGSTRYFPRENQIMIPQKISIISDSPLVKEEAHGQALSYHKTPLFTCEDSGVFPLKGSCKEFFYCETLRGPPFVFTCPQTTVFDAETKTCIPSALSTRPECKSYNFLKDSEGRRRKRSEAPASCSSEIIESLAESSREACASTRDIDTYITNVKAVRSLELRSFDKEEYKAIIRDYNSDLSLAQKNYDEWRHGKSIFSAIKETFLSAKNFEPTFNTKYEENQKRIQEITSKDTPDIKQMEEDIEALKTEIKEVQEVLSTLEGLPSDQGPVDFLKNRLREKEHELEQLVSNDSRVKTERKVAALIDFLEMVRLAVVDIQQNAIQTASRVETFQQKIVTDSSIFQRHRETAQNGIKDLQDQRKENENEKNRIVAEKKNLENRIQQENNEISRIRNLLQSAENELRNTERRLSKLREEARERQTIGAILFIIPVAGWIAGGALLGTAIADENRLRDQTRNTVNSYRNIISAHQSQIDIKSREILNAENRISTLTSKSRQLDEEVASFSNLDQDLARIQGDINSILPSVNKALTSVEKLKAVFDGIRQDLDGTLEVAKSRKEQAEEKNLLYFIYNSISELKCKWNKANVKIIALDQCN